MNKKEFNKAFEFAKVGYITDFADLIMFNGFALSDFGQVCCTLRDVAGLIRYQALQFNGNWDQEAIQEIWDCRKRFLIADGI